MKYLNRFNESKENEIEKLQDFCDDHLAFLSDDGFKSRVESYYLWGFIKKNINSQSLLKITIQKPTDLHEGLLLFKIIDIENEFLQFLDYLRTQYEILGTIIIKDKKGYNHIYSVDEVFNSNGKHYNYFLNVEISQIEIDKISPIE
jgi:hypothetical protein